MRNIHFTKLMAAAGLMSVIVLAPLHSARAVEYAGFGGKPAFPSADNPRTESIFIHTLAPGAVQQEGVLVVNNTAETKTLQVYGADSTPSTEGAFACKQFVEAKTDVGAWITLAQSEVTLGPLTNVVVPFTISVPVNAGVGEHNGCILIQEKKPAATGQTGAVLSVRTGIRVAITVPGDITRNLDVVSFTVVGSSGGGFVLQPAVKNNGNVSVDANAQVTTRYFFGLTYSVNGGQFPILRGDTSQWNFDLHKPFWGGWYLSTFTVVYDQNPEAGVGVASGKPLTTLSGYSVWFFSFPQPLALAIEIFVVLLIGSGIWFLFRLRKRRAVSVITTPIEVKKPDENIQK